MEIYSDTDTQHCWKVPVPFHLKNSEHSGSRVLTDPDPCIWILLSVIQKKNPDLDITYKFKIILKTKKLSALVNIFAFWTKMGSHLLKRHLSKKNH